MKNTGIVCTIGPSSSNPSVFSQMAEEGMTLARLNFSHGTHSFHGNLISMIKEHNRGRKTKVPVLQDLEGFRIRVASAGGGGGMEIEKGRMYFWGGAEDRRENYIRFDYEGPLNKIEPGSLLFADDGMLCFRVLETREKEIKTEAVLSGFLKNNKGVNLPGSKLEFGALKEKDRNDIMFGLGREVDFMAQSFVRSEADMLAVREIISGRKRPPALIAKIECREGIANIDRIISVSDGIMIARGDMGVSIPLYKVPVTQKLIINKCSVAGKLSITATQMLESMTDFPRPTRAEVSDVANAVLDGSDYLMLSGETAVGKYPVEAVTMMRKTAEYTVARMGDLKNPNC